MLVRALYKYLVIIIIIMSDCGRMSDCGAGVIVVWVG